MANQNLAQGTFSVLEQEADLYTWLEAFLIDRKAQNLSPGSIDFYRKKIRLFFTFCDDQIINSVLEINPRTIRKYLLYLEETGHNPGGIHSHYRAVRAFLNWFELEYEPEGWSNPIKKVKAPKVPLEPLEPVEIETIHKLIKTCDKSFIGLRDAAILLALLDTGTRASEFISIDLDDMNIITGEILIRHGKGNKFRTVFLGRKSRQAVRRYLKQRKDDNKALWITKDKDRLSYWGIRSILQRHSDLAGCLTVTAHSFRRAFAINMLRAGIDIFTIAKLMGHSSIAVLQRYLKISTGDIEQAHRKASPVDTLL